MPITLGKARQTEAYRVKGGMNKVLNLNLRQGRSGNTLRKLLVILSVYLCCQSVEATQFSNQLEPDAWSSESSVFECSMTHKLPFYGKAVFFTRAGEDSRFQLQAKSSRLKSGEALLEVRNPVWMETPKKINLGYVPIKQGLTPLSLNSRYTERMLAELYEGLELRIKRRPWYGAEVSTELAIGSIGFRAAYARYLDCLAGLLPANYEQIKRTAVYFGSSQFEDFQASEITKLDHIVAYVKADPSVKEFYIDGHTDSVGTREDNLELAQKRAEEVSRYLISKGIPQDAITSRWHGERYPVASNQSVQGRAKNRRVTIRLEKMKLEDKVSEQ